MRTTEVLALLGTVMLLSWAVTGMVFPIPIHAQSEEFSQYENTNMGIMIDYPSNWEIGEISGAVWIYSPLENSLDQISENVGIQLEYLREPISLEEYVNFSNDQLKLLDLEILDSKSTKIGDYPAWQTTYIVNLEGIKFQGQSIIMVESDIAYTIIFTALPESFSDYFPIVEKMINSFVILGELETTGKDIRELIQQANQFYFSNKPHEALKTLDKVLIIQPDNYDVLLFKSALFIELKKNIDAEKTVDKVLEMNPFDVEAQLLKALALAGQEKFDEAMPYINDYLKIIPNDSAVLAVKSIVLVEIGNYEEAESTINKAIELNPNDPFAMYGKGFYFHNIKNYDQAIQYYDKALEISPNEPDFLNDKGVSLLEQGKFVKAESIFDKILKIESNHSFALNNKGIILLERGNYVDALDYFDKALEIEPDNLLFLRNKVATLSNMGIADLAQIIYDKIMGLNPEFDESLESITRGATSLQK